MPVVILATVLMGTGFPVAKPVPQHCALSPDRAQASVEELKRFEFERIQMGVTFKIVLYAYDQSTANKAAAAAYARIRQLDAIMSDYDPNSELMRFCRLSGPGRPVKVSRDLRFVICRALALSQTTNGAFDITVGPFVKLWRRARRQKRLPSPKRLQDARAVVGFGLVKLDHGACRAELLKNGMKLDLGGIAKGYAADAALAVLKQHDISRSLIDASGDIVVGDPPPGKAGWLIGIAELPFEATKTGSGFVSSPAAESPTNASRDKTRPDPVLRRFLCLQNCSVATSGDAFQYIEIDGIRYSHIINPRTGLGLKTRNSVTVIAADGITADSLASAVSVLGPKRGFTLIEAQADRAALIVQVTDDAPETFVSKRFDSFLVTD